MISNVIFSQGKPPNYVSRRDLVMSWLKEVIGTEKAIIAMCHMQPLPGDPQYNKDLGMEWIVEKTYADAEALFQ